MMKKKLVFETLQDTFVELQNKKPKMARNNFIETGNLPWFIVFVKTW